MLLMFIYQAEQGCPELLVILSTSGTVSFVSPNETERNSGLLTVHGRWERRADEGRQPVFVRRLSGALLYCSGLVLFKEAVSKSTK